MAMSMISPKLPLQRNRSLFSPHQVKISRHAKSSYGVSGISSSISLHNESEGPSRRLSFSVGRGLGHVAWPISAVRSGLEASIADKKKNDISLEDVKIVIKSRDDDKIHVRVDLTGEQTQKAFDDVLTNLARTAPPMPGFRRMKGGKTSNVPKSFLLQMLGRDRVTKFLIQEVVSTAIGDFVKKENFTIKTQFQTAQTAEELESAFAPGSEFGFDAALEIVRPDSGTTTSDSDSSEPET